MVTTSFTLPVGRAMKRIEVDEKLWEEVCWHRDSQTSIVMAIARVGGRTSEMLANGRGRRTRRGQKVQ